MSKNITVPELRAQGYKVRVTHMRYLMAPFHNATISQTVSVPTLAVARKNDIGPNGEKIPQEFIVKDGLLFGPQSEAISNGGVTVVDLLYPDGVTVITGTAECSINDNYNRKRGLFIALGRIKAQWDFEKKFPQENIGLEINIPVK